MLHASLSPLSSCVYEVRSTFLISRRQWSSAPPIGRAVPVLLPSDRRDLTAVEAQREDVRQERAPCLRRPRRRREHDRLPVRRERSVLHYLHVCAEARQPPQPGAVGAHYEEVALVLEVGPAVGRVA